MDTMDEFDRMVENEKVKESHDTISIWNILERQLLYPVYRTGYLDINEFFDNATHDASKMRKQLKDSGSPIADFNPKKYFGEKPVDDPDGVGFVFADMDGFFRACTKELSEYEILAVTVFVFYAKDRRYKEAVIDALIGKYDHGHPIEFLRSERIIFDSTKIDIKIISDTVQYVQQLELVLDNNPNKIFFRGHGRSTYRLLPSLLREKKWYQNERKMYLTLMANCPQDFSSLHTHLDILSEMQHYGLPTRLIDVTSDALTALYFTCEHADNFNGEVLLLEASDDKILFANDVRGSMLASLPLFSYEEQRKLFEYAKNGVNGKVTDKLKEKLRAEVRSERTYTTLRDEFPHLTSYFYVLPRKWNKRIANQDGAFVLCGLLDEIYDKSQQKSGGVANEGVLEDLRVKIGGRRVVFIIKNKKKILKQLETYGIHQMRVYPEIEKVSEYIKDHIEEI